MKAKVLPQLEEIQKKSQGDALAGNKGKQIIQKVSYHLFESLDLRASSALLPRFES